MPTTPPTTIISTGTDPALSVFAPKPQLVPIGAGNTTVNITEVTNYVSSVNVTNQPGGSANEVQINEGGRFAGDPGLIYNATTDQLTVAGNLIVGASLVTNSLKYANGVSWMSALSGASGISGFSGIDGAPGAVGASGFSGIDGAPGAVGASGFSGIDGAPGAVGASGFSGIDGAPGAVGASGFSGIDGAPGAVGASGFSGIDGSLFSTVEEHFSLDPAQYTLVLADSNKVLVLSSGANISITVPDYANVPFLVGSQMKICIDPTSASQATFFPGTDVILMSGNGATVPSAGTASIINVAQNKWYLSGDLQI